MQHRQLNHKEVRQMFSAAERPTPPLVLVTNNIKDSRNIGALFRLADAAGIDSLYTIGASELNELKIQRVARAANRHIHLHELHSVEELLKLREEFELVALEITSASITYTEYRPQKGVALIVGNEKEGISKEILEMVDRSVHIPMYGVGSSMNVAMAAGIVVYGLLPYLPQDSRSV